MDKKIAFIGSGNMGKAIIGGIVKSQLTAASNLHVFDIDSSKSREMAEQFGSTVATSATSAAAVADILLSPSNPMSFRPCCPNSRPISSQAASLSLSPPG